VDIKASPEKTTYFKEVEEEEEERVLKACTSFVSYYESEQIAWAWQAWLPYVHRHRRAEGMQPKAEVFGPQ
jgi:hypothetical protein